VVWHHLIDTPATKKFVADFRGRYNRPPENQAWGDYNAMRLTAQAMAETKSIDATKIVEHFEKGAKFGLMKTREGYFRKADHQMMHEMYTVTALPVAQVKNEWDIFSSSAPVPGANESLEVIATQGEEIECKMS
jgi:branched-chain amino acid transport system substrate-binding protein